jgi:hypothetical protein
LSSDDRPPPKQFDWALKVFDKMMAEATPQTFEGDSPAFDGAPVMVYEGHLTRLFSELGIANPYYTSIMKALKDTGCVEQLRRGGGSAKSQWVLISRPTVDQFMERAERKRANNSKIGQMEQQLRDLRKTLGDVLERVEKLEEVR